MAKTETMFLLEEFVKKKLVNVLLAMSAFPLVFLTVIVFVAACSDCDYSFSVPIHLTYFCEAYLIPDFAVVYVDETNSRFVDDVFSPRTCLCCPSLHLH